MVPDSIRKELKGRHSINVERYGNSSFFFFFGRNLLLFVASPGSVNQGDGETRCVWKDA